jgi:2-polyprenyl-6-methoxyphenol hydroxylase-like FAD-dependent oxidoreductase
LGHKVVVYEKEAYLGERVREWTILIHWALPVFQKLLPDHIVADLHTAYGDPFYKYDQEDERLPYYNGETGEVAFTIPAVGVRRVSRTRLRGLCTRGLDVQWSKQFKELDMDETGGPVVVKFQDGDTAEVDLVIGTDGSNSAVRRWLVGDEAGAAKPSEMAICNGTVNYKDAEKAKFLRAPNPILMIAFASTGSALFAGMTIP